MEPIPETHLDLDTTPVAKGRPKAKDYGFSTLVVSDSKKSELSEKSKSLDIESQQETAEKERKNPTTINPAIGSGPKIDNEESF